MIMNINGDVIEENDKMVTSLYRRFSYTYAPKKFNLDLKKPLPPTPPARHSIEESSILELKVVPSHLHYDLWGSTIPYR